METENRGEVAAQSEAKSPKVCICICNFAIVFVFISVLLSVFIAEVKSPKAFNCDDDEAAGAKLKAKPTTSYCYQSF